ncbi:MAG: GDP-L-fucose synthase [Bacteroidia bacterium]|nr:GDP-L-fucose synthase [Bacteroidia bacterium]MBT8309675.1 GDP-L-fucose synthase [Bacteroidia bacterium]NND11529.1 GDP-L-fucose synthase [Flavobacteriaceae bacterium]NNK27461.1 GDP-L-fucose synthase [Flavobacteriaceae bacterium]NNL60412.1 GDP-L-fucose synthase [Flavobacteriaceae bacterium]
MKKDSKIFIAGHQGLVGSAIHENLLNKGFKNIITRTRKELNLIDQEKVADFFELEKPEFVFLAAAKVGGIVANNVFRAEFIYENLMIQNNVIHQSYLNGVKKLLFLGSTCIYPKNSPQPMKEEYLLTDILEYTNEPYAIAKIAGIKMCESYNLQYGTNFISVMPTNLYGPNDNFDLEKSHVLPALIRKIHLGKLLSESKYDEVISDVGVATIEEAKTYLKDFGVTANSVEIWGTGKPKREFLWSEEMADACVFIMQKRDFSDTYDRGSKEIRNTHINIGTGLDVSIKELSEMIKKRIGYQGKLLFNSNKPDGTMRKLTDVTKLNNLGWQHSINLEEGINLMYDWYLCKK